MASVDTSPAVDMDLLSDRKPRSEEEKKAMQLAKVNALRERLRVREEELVRKLVQGGEFRPGEEPLNKAYLRRWLRARDWKIEKTEECIRSHAEWRVNYCPHGRVLESEIENELGAGKLFLQGTDKKGQGLMIVLGAKHNAWTRDAAEVERAICYSIDAQLDIADTTINPDRRTTVLFDLSNLGVTCVDMVVMTQIYDILSKHFVERLGILYVYNAPTFFWATWKSFTPLLPEVTLKKVKFIYSDDLSELYEDVQLEILPKEYGGRAEYVPLQEAVTAMRNSNKAKN